MLSEGPLDPWSATNIHWQFVNVVPGPDPLQPVDCQLAEYLTPGGHAVDPGDVSRPGGHERYVVVSAQDPGSYKTDWAQNSLIGSEVVVNQVGGMYVLNAIPFRSPQPHKSHTDADTPSGGFTVGPGDGDGRMDFDGIEYEAIPDDLFGDVFLAIGGSTLTLLDFSAGPNFTATVGFDVWNDNEYPLSSTLRFRCWFEEELADLSMAFRRGYLRKNTLHDPQEVAEDCDGVGDLEAGWFRIRGIEHSSLDPTCLNPALLGALSAGPRLNGLVNGAHLLWESIPRQVNGEFLTFSTTIEDCRDSQPVPPGPPV